MQPEPSGKIAYRSC